MRQESRKSNFCAHPIFSSSDEEKEGPNGKKQKHFDLREEERERRLAAKKERKKKFKSKVVSYFEFFSKLKKSKLVT